MNEPIDKNSDWGPCPEGELARAVRQLKRQRRDRAIVTFVGAAGGALVLLLGVGLLLSQLSGNRVGDGGFTCAECRQNLDAYIRHSLGPELSEKVRLHLDRCPGCEREHQRRQHITSGAQQDCDCPSCRPWLASAGFHD